MVHKQPDVVGERSMVQSEAKFLIELLNICFIDKTDLVLWLTYCMKKPFLHLGCKHV